jgi:alpha-L-fucosidase
MKTISKLFFCYLTTLAAFTVSAQETSSKTQIVVPTEKQVDWANCEIGVIIHFDMPVFHPEYNWRNYGTHPNASEFAPTSVNTDQWIRTAKQLGAKYAILVAKHCSGFSLWPTKAHEYSIKHSPWKNGQGDIVADFIHSCHKYGVRPGIYASTSANGFLHVDAHNVDPNGPVTKEQYNQIIATQLSELWSNYGPLFEVWFDGGVLAKEKGGTDVASLLKRLQPNAIAFQGPKDFPNLIRWVGNEEGVAPYPCWATSDASTDEEGNVNYDGLHGNPYAPLWCPGESDYTLRWTNSFQGGWFWKAGEENKRYTLQEMMKRYETSVGRNTNMLLGMVIDNNGRVPEVDANELILLGKAIKAKYGHPYKSSHREGTDITLSLNKPAYIDRTVIQEDIRMGELVLKYEIEGLSNGQWIKLAEGSNIGHKRIDTFQPTLVKAVRLHILSSKAPPHISNFAIYKHS